MVHSGLFKYINNFALPIKLSMDQEGRLMAARQVLWN
jgi:hypothetical protein